MNYQDRLDNMRSMMKRRHDNDVTDCTGPLYFENKTTLL